MLTQTKIYEPCTLGYYTSFKLYSLLIYTLFVGKVLSCRLISLNFPPFSHQNKYTLKQTKVQKNTILKISFVNCSLKALVFNGLPIVRIVFFHIMLYQFLFKISVQKAFKSCSVSCFYMKLQICKSCKISVSTVIFLKVLWISQGYPTKVFLPHCLGNM